MKNVHKYIICFFILIIISGCNDNSYDSWHLNNLDVNKLWEYSKGESQVIAFIDTGVSDELATHLSDRIIFKYNIIDNNQNVKDYHGHGSEMISVACGDGFSNVYGIAPNSKIIVLKAVSNEGKTDNDYLFQALKMAQNKGATIVNISLGGYKYNEKVSKQINTMVNQNIAIVAAAGDYNNKDLLFPASLNNVISVEASNKSGERWKDSNHSEDSLIRMPGCDIDVLSLDSNGIACKSTASGTSQAAAIASGYIALIKDYKLSNDTVLSNSELIELLRSLGTKNSDKIDYTIPFK